MSAWLDRLDWTERLTIVLTVVFAASLALVLRVDSALLWLGWGVVMVLLSGWALIAVNRSD